MQTSAFRYHLPDTAIAQQPTEPRDHCKLLVVDRQADTWSHYHFYDLPQWLSSGDVLVLNDTRVLPVRVFGQKPTGGSVEVLFAHRQPEFCTANTEVWEVLTRPGLKRGQTLRFLVDSHDFDDKKTSDDTSVELTVLRDDLDGPVRQVSVNLGHPDFLQFLQHNGTVPTPPYITEFVGDPELYQTVFGTRGGSAAAPTAGLHFTPELLQKITDMGVNIAPVTLHVGLGTFLPVTVDTVQDHTMHYEWYEFSQETAEIINRAKQTGKQVTAVGTTSLRTLETVAAPSLSQNGKLSAHTDQTNLFVYPPYQFRVVDHLVTNFHVPESTLLMLVSAFTSQPQTNYPFTNFENSLLGRAYADALANNYRFFSFGDAMLIQ